MRRIVAVAVVFLLLAGCKHGTSKGTVTGTVTYKGQPVNGATLHLFPAAGTKGSALEIPVDQDGTFTVSGVAAGDYKVTVEPNPGNPGPSTKGMSPAQIEKMKDQIAQMKVPATITIPKKYQDKDKTDLTMPVTTGKQTVDLELKG